MTDTYEVEIDLDAGAERVWQALTDPRELEQWFAEHADVDLDEGRFDFWGCHTPGVPTKDEGHRHVVECDPMRQLRFVWPWNGEDTIVTISLEGDTRLRVLHENVAERPNPMGHLPSHLWSFALGHLRAYLATGRPGPRFDWSWPHHGGFTAHADIEASVDAVWTELVDRSWLAPDNVRRHPARHDGEDFAFDVGVMVGVKIVDLVENQHLTLEWIEDRATVLSYTLEGSGGRTHLTVVHSGFDDDLDIQGMAEGFFSGVLEAAWVLESNGTWQRPAPTASTAGDLGGGRVLQDGQHDRRLATERAESSTTA